MISTADALQIVLENSGQPKLIEVPLEKAAGYVLAQDVHSDIDMPPFNRSAMDGFALAGDELRYELLEDITAGDSREVTLKPGLAAPIMTGALVPEGADRIVIVENSRVEESVLYLDKVPDTGANICWKGQDIKEGQTVLEHGTRLASQHIGIAAAAGMGVLDVFSKPRIALVTTGTEVIPPTWKPSPGTVRNANMSLMNAQLSIGGFSVDLTVHSADDPESLKATFKQLLRCADVLIVAGGVSKGTRDFVPSVLESLGVKLHIRTVAQKPGKPLLFGNDPEGRPVFGLPGNPVSVMVSIEEYVLPLLRKRAGCKGYHKRIYHGELTSDYRKKPGRLHFLRVIAYRESHTWKLHHPASSGSGDLMSTVNVNALALAGEDVVSLRSGDIMSFHFFYSTAGELSFA